MAIAVYGLGRFGHFFAHMLSRIDDVVAYSRSEDRSTPEGVTRVGLDGLVEADTIFLCVSISALEEVVKDLSPRLRPGTTVVDTCSVKVEPARWMDIHLREDIRIIASHPMFGPDSARDSLLDLPITLWSVRNADAEVERWTAAFRGLGLRVLSMSPDEHDRIAAYTQGVTHFIGRVLEELSSEDSDIATKGYKQLLEVKQQTCNDPWQLFLDLQRFNPYTGDMRRDLVSALDSVLQKIQVDSDSGAP